MPKAVSTSSAFVVEVGASLITPPYRQSVFLLLFQLQYTIVVLEPVGRIVKCEGKEAF